MPKKINYNKFLHLDFSGAGISKANVQIECPFLPDEIIFNNIVAHFPNTAQNSYYLSSNIVDGQTLCFLSDISSALSSNNNPIRYIISQNKLVQGYYDFNLNFANGSPNTVNTIILMNIEFIQYLDH